MKLLLAALAATGALFAQTLEQAESLWKQHQYDAANNTFRALVAAHPRNALYRVRWGYLLFERFNSADAAKLFNEALAIDPKRADALLGLAQVAAGGFEEAAVEFAHRALEADPHLVAAQELLARLALEDNDPERAAEEAHKALSMSAQAIQAKAILATIDWLNDRSGAEWDPQAGAAYETAGRIFVRIAATRKPFSFSEKPSP